MTDWVPLLLTGLGAGVIGSVITTYGSQARERRDARKEVLSRLADADRTAGQPSSDRKAVLDAGRAVGTAALLAGVPRYLVDTYLIAYDAARDDRLTWGPSRITPSDPISVGAHLYHEATGLLTMVLWHPLLMLPVRRYRSRRIRRFLFGVLPPGATIFLGRSRRQENGNERRSRPPKLVPTAAAVAHKKGRCSSMRRSVFVLTSSRAC